MAMITCPECGAQISDKATACPKCGSPIVVKKKCEECGAELPDGATKCPSCGAPVKANNNNGATITISTGGTKSKSVFAVLALLLGFFGAQYFYIGKATAGVIFIVLSCTGIGMIFTAIISLIQCFKGLTMSQEEFERKYINIPDKNFPLV